VSLSSVSDQPAGVAAAKQSSAWARIGRLIPFAYVVTAVGLTWQLWRDPKVMAPNIGGSTLPRDIYLNAWFLRYAAAAVSHGHLPALVTTAVNFPQGVSAMWNTSMLLPSILLTPVTLIAGPMVSLSILLTVGFAGSAAALFFVLRRWEVSTGAAGIAGALYGFSPAMMVAAEDHYHLQFAVLPPLIVDAVLRLVTGRGRAVHTGMWLGLLAAAQIFIAEEVLVDTAVACAVIVVMLALCQPMHMIETLRAPDGALGRARGFVAGLGMAMGVSLLLAGDALLSQFRGRLAEYGSPWHMAQYGSQPADFVTAPDAMAFHGQFVLFLARTSQRLVETLSYLGWPLLVLLVVIAIGFWRDLRVRVITLTLGVLELMSVGGHRVHAGSWHIPVILQPWHWLWHLPVVGLALPSRIAIIADGVAATVIAFGVDGTKRAARQAGTWRKPVIACSTVLALAAFVPVIPRPVPAAQIDPVPAGLTSILSRLHLRPWAPVLVLPQDPALTMEWQAITGARFSIAGGYCIVRGDDGKADPCDSAETLTNAQNDARFALQEMITEVPFRSGLARYYPLSDGPSLKVLEQALGAWRSEVILVEFGASTWRVENYLLAVLGRPTVQVGNLLAWRTAQAIQTLRAHIDH